MLEIETNTIIAKSTTKEGIFKRVLGRCYRIVENFKQRGEKLFLLALLLSYQAF